jgi:hypothetical protein
VHGSVSRWTGTAGCRERFANARAESEAARDFLHPPRGDGGIR